MWLKFCVIKYGPIHNLNALIVTERNLVILLLKNSPNE